MGVFDGVLLCTDLDGTLADGRSINKADADAINYFKENGGKFTLCTGRVYNYLTGLFDCVSPNTYVISLNGALITDPITKEILKSGFLGADYNAAFNTVFSFYEQINEFYVYYENCVDNVKITVEDYLKKRNEIDQAKRIHKIVFAFKNEEYAVRAEEAVNKAKRKNIICTRSWPTGVELLDNQSTKGAAVKLLKATLGAKLLVCAGDFENDITMIEEADIGYAVENAIPLLKAKADRITVSQKDGAISHIINEIELLLKNKPKI